MIKNISIVACTTILFLISCMKDNVELSKTNYLIFGHFYGECLGEECIEIFRLEDNKLFEGTSDTYPKRDDFYEGDYVQLSEEKFKITKDLVNSFPSELLKETNHVIGQPDAGDWGGLYIEYNFDGVRNFWSIDQMKSNVPERYHNFIDEVNEKILQLK